VHDVQIGHVLLFAWHYGLLPLQSLWSGLRKSAYAGVTGAKNNERFARAGKATLMANGL
jgi:hypothetical protein